MTAQRLASRIHTVGLVRAVLAVALILTGIRCVVLFTPFSGFLAGLSYSLGLFLALWATVDAMRAERAFRVALE